jgi:hypothetical protein
MQIQNFAGTVTLTRRIREQDAAGGYSWKEIPTSCRVQLSIDVDGLLHLLGAKALQNKTKRSKMGRYIQATATVNAR